LNLISPEHRSGCNITEVTVFLKFLRQLILDRSEVMGVCQQEVYEHAIVEYGDSPGIETFQTQFSLKSAQSRRQVSNRPIDPTLQTIGTFFIAPQLEVTMNTNNPENFVLHRQTFQDPAVGTVGFIIFGVPRMVRMLHFKLHVTRSINCGV
jgi:hypothetical protein